MIGCWSLYIYYSYFSNQSPVFLFFSLQQIWCPLTDRVVSLLCDKKNVVQPWASMNSLLHCCWLVKQIVGGRCQPCKVLTRELLFLQVSREWGSSFLDEGIQDVRSPNCREQNEGEFLNRPSHSWASTRLCFNLLLLLLVTCALCSHLTFKGRWLANLLHCHIQTMEHPATATDSQSLSLGMNSGLSPSHPHFLVSSHPWHWSRSGFWLVLWCGHGILRWTADCEEDVFMSLELVS